MAGLPSAELRARRLDKFLPGRATASDLVPRSARDQLNSGPRGRQACQFGNPIGAGRGNTERGRRVVVQDHNLGITVRVNPTQKLATLGKRDRSRSTNDDVDLTPRNHQPIHEVTINAPIPGRQTNPLLKRKLHADRRPVLANQPVSGHREFIRWVQIPGCKNLSRCRRNNVRLRHIGASSKEEEKHRQLKWAGTESHDPSPFAKTHEEPNLASELSKIHTVTRSERGRRGPYRPLTRIRASPQDLDLVTRPHLPFPSTACAQLTRT